jgi:hypothetical protein
MPIDRSGVYRPLPHGRLPWSPPELRTLAQLAVDRDELSSAELAGELAARGFPPRSAGAIDAKLVEALAWDRFTPEDRERMHRRWHAERRAGLMAAKEQLAREIKLAQLERDSVPLLRIKLPARV